MKNWLIGAVILALGTTLLPTDVDAKRLGGGKNSGMQRNMPERTAPDAPAAKPAPQQAGTPGQQAAPGAPATAGAAAAAAAPAKRSWMGPIAGLAAGLGLAALMSHLGLGEAFANFLMLALLAVAVVFLVAFLMRRFRRAPAQPALAGAGAAGATQVAWPSAAQPAAQERRAFDASPSSGAADQSAGSSPLSSVEPAIAPSTAAPVAKAFVPAAFDSEGFERTAKMIFIRLQAANDAADLDDLRRFTTPELFASLRLDLQDRGAAAQHTDVTRVDAHVLDVTNEADRQVVSVRFQGELTEEKGAAPTAFNEVWHLVKPHGDSGSWAIAGIEQMS